MIRQLRLGTRGSLLARTQSQWVADQCTALGLSVSLNIIRTAGDNAPDRPVDRFSTKGIFVAEIEQALQRGEIDLAVHSLKDLPGENAPGLTLAAIPLREDARDVLVGRTAPLLSEQPQHARIGTSSLRRRAQLHAVRPDLNLLDMRGNVDTRLRKLDEGMYDAICLAAAGLHRLGLRQRITEYFPLETLVPPAGQGALAIQTRADDIELITALAPLHDDATGRAIRIERQVLGALGGGCETPIGVHAQVDGDRYHVLGVLCSPFGVVIARESIDRSGEPEAIGDIMANLLRIHQ